MLLFINRQNFSVFNGYFAFENSTIKNVYYLPLYGHCIKLQNTSIKKAGKPASYSLFLKILKTCFQPLKISIGIWHITNGIVEKFHIMVQQHIKRLRIVVEVNGLKGCPFVAYGFNGFCRTIWP